MMSWPLSGQSTEREKILGMRYDHLLHLQTCAFMSLSLHQWTSNMVVSLTVPFVVAGVKELYDRKKNNGEWTQDAYSDMYYSVVGAF